MTVPGELAALPRWVCWKLVTRKGKATKVPHRATDGRLASTTKVEDWCTFEEALEATEQLGMDGVGFVFFKDDPYCGADLDHCFQDNGNIHPEAQKVIDDLDSYTELSPSGTGVHVIFKGNLEANRKITDTEWGGNLEFKKDRGYFTVTGQGLNGSEIRDVGQIDVEVPSLDNDLIDRCSKKYHKFNSLFYEGEVDKSPSEADVDLANIFALETGDAFQIERLMRKSELVRDKWDHPDRGTTWIRTTIANALEWAKDKRGKKEQNKSPLAWTMDPEEDVRRQMYMLEVREEARRRLLEVDSIGLNLGSGTLRDQLAAPRVESLYRIDELHPTGGNVLLIAERKSGKSALVLNLIKALADNVPFMGRFDVEPFAGNIAVFNYEERESQWLRHAEKLGIEQGFRVWPQHRRGASSLPVWNRRTREEVVEWMIENEIVYWIMDPAAMAWQGLVENENDNALVTAFTMSLDMVKEEAGIQELVLIHHTGRSGDRGRGAMRLEDWADALWYLEKDGVAEDGAAQRYLWAEGRDVDVERFRLLWEDWTFTAGESESDRTKKEAIKQSRDTRSMAIEILREQGPLSLTKLGTALRSAGVGMKGGTLKDKLLRWARDADNPIHVEADIKSGKTFYTFSVE